MTYIVFVKRETAGRESRLSSSSQGESMRSESHEYCRLHKASLRGKSDVYRLRKARVCGAKVTNIVDFTRRESAERKSRLSSSSQGESMRGESHAYRRLYKVRVCGAKVTYIVVFTRRESAGRKSRISSSSPGESLRSKSHEHFRRSQGETLQGESPRGESGGTRREDVS